MWDIHTCCGVKVDDNKTVVTCVDMPYQHYYHRCFKTVTIIAKTIFTKAIVPILIIKILPTNIFSLKLLMYDLPDGYSEN